MRRFSKVACIVIIFCCVLRGEVRAQEVMRLTPITAQDRILIFAPHPDDEAIGTAGLIQEALKAGATVKIVCFTNGDANQLSFIFYEKRFTIFKGEILHMGEVRRKETLAAMEFLGLKPQDITFLGYPDFGTMTILTRYWGDTKPYRSVLSRVTKVSYPDALTPKAPYVGESILADLKHVLSEYKPTKIFVSHPADTNRDHRALYLFLRIALWDLEGKISAPQVSPYLVHARGWPKPRGYHPDLFLDPPQGYNGIAWSKFTLTDQQVQSKHDCILKYRSQRSFAAAYLLTFARKNELFGDYPVVFLKDAGPSEISWQSFEVPVAQGEEEYGTQAEEEEMAERRAQNKDAISTLAYAHQDKSLLIRITTRRKMDKDNGVSLYLLGYSKEKNFAAMPKIRMTIGLFGAKFMDKKRVVKIKGFKITYGKDFFILKIPLEALGHPDYILSSAYAAGFSSEASAWRILQIE